ncbi:hypothetical protein GCM10022281_25410 [Sphingomonas rosea]|uniref:Msp4/OMP-like domain-containing protein n=1 Tax=Sphingomonas rosea TaxID=335605 RepID=A0ABP7UGT5_9SPHN
MRLTLLAASAAAAIAAPAFAQTGPYAGIEGGILFPKSRSGTATTVFSQTAQTPAAGTAATSGTGAVGTLPTTLTTLPAGGSFSERVKYKKGYDVDGIIGYDFGAFRLEGEVGYKRSKVKSFSQDAALGTGLTTFFTPTGTTTGTTFVYPGSSLGVYNLRDHVSVLSGMVNALLDLGGSNGVPAFYIGAGAGRARVKALGDRDSAWAYQGIAGVRFPISDNIDLGLKYRYFRTAKLDLDPVNTGFSQTFTAAVPNVATTAVPAPTGSSNVSFTRSGVVSQDFNNRFSSHSLLASLIFNFGRTAEMAPPPPPPPAPVVETPPPPPPPATQTCPDGSVILATDACPVPPPPPPPPAPAPERG